MSETFEKWMENNTNKAPLTIGVYVNIIKKFKSKHHAKFNIEDVNKFIIDHFRKKSCTNVKYAFRYYFKYLGIEERYSELVKVKQKGRIKKGVHVSKEVLFEIIRNIKNPLYRDVAVLQYQTGARGREILTLREEDIDLYFSDDLISIRILGKGEKIRYSYVPNKKSWIDFFKRNMSSAKLGFLFLTDEFKDFPRGEFDRKVSSQMTLYYNYLHRSAMEYGVLGFGTHDLRRNAAEHLKKYKKVDMHTIKKILGHSNILITEKYFDESDDSVQEAMRE
jgi:integrase